MTLQSLLVAGVVALCTAHVVWRLLLPAATRRRMALRLLRAALPEALARSLRADAQAAAGCHCDGCDRAAPHAARASGQTVNWVPRERR
jgi:hypothetical protein